MNVKIGPLQPGEVLYATQDFTTFSGKEYERGDTFELLELTAQAPYGHLSPLGNFYVKCKHFRPPMPQSVWSGMWSMLEQGYLSRSKP